MLAAVLRYRRLVSETLARYFPHTTAYLRAQREQQAPPPKAKAKARKRLPAESKHAAATSAPPPARLRISARQVEAMRARVADAVAAGLLGAPSDEQWAMILARQPQTRIFAGAGSGKSTTLVLRVVFMLCHLGVEPTRLTVISFTNASCAQLRTQLARLLDFWGYAGTADQCVRTFHSAMGQLAKAAWGSPTWFEQLGAKGGEPDNPLAGGRLPAPQQRVLEEVYQACYADDPLFRSQVHTLLGLAEPPAGQPPGKAPRGTFRLAGERAPLSLVEAFYTQLGFIESIGLRIERLRPAELVCPPREREFVEALQRFAAGLADHLQARGLLTFNAAFQRLTDEVATIPAEALAPLGHLLIDEFQDISPQIVHWLQAVQRTLAERGEAVSLMAIGDDWQSIYGWRGSSPELFMDFDRHFPGTGRNKRSAVLTLATNYRSVEAVIRDGEAVLGGVACKQAKTCRAFRPTQNSDHGVRLVTGFDLKSQLPVLLEEIRQQCAHVAKRRGADGTAVLLLARRNETLKTIKAQLDPALPVQAHTIHRAKGLQAEVAIIVDDCQPVDAHPLRAALYAQAGCFRNGYDQAMQDESLRLGYVAITRGVSRVLWYTRQLQGATRLLDESRRS